MPRVPGRESSKKTFKVEDVLVGSSIMQHETWYWRRPCNAEGCDHRIGPDTTKARWALEWESCDPGHLPAFVAFSATLKSAGIACPCCVAKTLA